jgi:hypothetical protein
LETTKEVKHLHTAVALMKRIIWCEGGNWQTTEARRERAKAGLAVLAMVEHLKDPNFDPRRDRGLMRLIPPREASGVQQNAGAPLEAVKDPVARAQYEAALKENAEKIKRANLQCDLRYLESEVQFCVETLLKYTYSFSAEDQKELNTTS